jgi:hypothetical protein
MVSWSKTQKNYNAYTLSAPPPNGSESDDANAEPRNRPPEPHFPPTQTQKSRPATVSMWRPAKTRKQAVERQLSSVSRMR